MIDRKFGAFGAFVLFLGACTATALARDGFGPEFGSGKITSELSSLTERELRSAAIQVASLTLTFGSSYSSGNLVFGGGQAL